MSLDLLNNGTSKVANGQSDNGSVTPNGKPVAAIEFRDVDLAFDDQDVLDKVSF
jgi:hypothetical protein